MNTPEFLPVLSAGSHLSPAEGACVMEMISLLAGERWTDRPSCTHPVLAQAARTVNDRLPDGERHLLVPLIGRLFGTAPVGTSLEQQQLSVRLAAWCARRVLPLVRERDQAACGAAIGAALAWAEDPSEQNRAAARAARAAHAVSVDAAYAAYAASAAVSAAATSASAAAAATYTAAAAAVADDLVGFLTGLLDEHDRLTGRTSHNPDAPAEAARLYALILDGAA